MAKRLRRRIQHERLGERRPEKRSDWVKLFPRETKMARVLARLQSKMQEKVLWQEGQVIGRLREEKVVRALQNLKNKGEIRDFLWMGKLSYADLIEGVDFLFTYVDGGYRICRFSVTGWKWVAKHLERHPEVPTFSVNLDENMKSVE